MKKILALALCVALLCSGCWSSKNSFEDIINDTGNNNYNNNNNNNADANTDKHYDTVAEALANENDMNLYYFLLKYSDLIEKESQSVTYQQLMRSKDGLKGDCVKITGEISQVVSDNDNGLECIVGLINITHVKNGYYDYYDDSVYFVIPVDAVSVRPVVGDKATMWGICNGFYNFEMSNGALDTLPTLATCKVQFLN